MSGSGILVSFEDIPTMSATFQSELRAYAVGKLGQGASATPAPAGSPGAAQLSLPQAELFLENCGDRTISVLKQIVARDGRFTVADVATAVRLRQDELRGVWGGLTKRVRTITGNKRALLIDWKHKAGRWHGTLAPITTASLETALKNY